MTMNLSDEQIFKIRQKKLIPVINKKGVVVRVYPANKTVDLYFINDPKTVVKSVPCSNAVNMLTIIPGQKCKVDIFDEANAKDFVVAYTY
jgi:hypothetical protein